MRIDLASQSENLPARLMTGAEAIVDGLAVQGVDTLFGLPGAQIYGLFDAVERATPKIRVIGARHEQACGYMAFGAARSTGKPSVFSVVPGPGLLNAGAALLTAFGANSPILCLTGQTPTDFLGKGRGHLHEMPDQLATVRGFVKWADRIEHPAQAPYLVARAFQEMTSGRAGPASLEMPWNVFAQSTPVVPASALPPLPPPPVDEDIVAQLAKLVRAARAPMIFVGSGANHAGEEILELARLIGAPVVGFRSGRGIVSEDDPLGMNFAAAYELWSRTDLAIGIGTRMEVQGWRWKYQPPALKIARIDIDPVELRRAACNVGLVADAAEGTRALIAALRRQGVHSSGCEALIEQAKQSAERAFSSLKPQIGYLRALREVLPRDGFVTDELSQIGFASWFGLPVYQPRTYVSSGYQGTLGSGFPTALGVKIANPDKPVVALCGDGGFMFAVQELATAVQYGIGVVTLVFNNESYFNVQRDQMQSFGGRVVASDLVNPDFVKLARAFGVSAARVNSPKALQKALEKAFAEGGPWLIEVPVPKGSESDPWRFIHPAPPT